VTSTGGAKTASANSSPGGSSGGRSFSGSGGSSAVTVSAKLMKPETVREFVKLNGDVTSESQVAVLPQVSGTITRLPVDLGDNVRRGQVIARVMPTAVGYAETDVTAPIGGTITKLPVYVGSAVSANSTSIATIGSLNDLRIYVYVAEKYSAYLKIGLPALVSFSAAPGETFNAHVTEIAPVVNPDDRTIETRLKLDKADPRFKAGMFAAVELVIRHVDNAMAIPVNAVKQYNGKNVVYIVENGKAKRVNVEIGLTNDSVVQITKGVKAGDRVITEGLVGDGSLVHIAGTSKGE
jgi:multidrug efflux pump subunit AcrA (membrane-fusion protein)